MPLSTRDDELVPDEQPGLTDRTHRVAYGTFRQQLRRQAARLDVPGWSTMTAPELTDAIAREEREAG